jgi:D-galactarolactone cycloisomerase
MYFREADDLAAELAREAHGYLGEGFRAVKMKVGLGTRQDVENVRAVREAVGGATTLMVDANHAYTLAEARGVAAALAEYGIGWFEEPLPPEDYDGYRELRAATSIPIAAGECEYLAAGFRRILEGRCVDVVQPDICACGGLTEAARIRALARVHGTPMAPHCWGTGIAFAAALHFVGTIDAVPGRLHSPEPVLEMDRTESPLRDLVTIPRFEQRDGYVRVPDGPGLGVTLDEEAARRYRVE